MKGILSVLLLLPLVGCLTSSAPTVAYWPLVYMSDHVSAKQSADAMSIENAPRSKQYKFGSARLSQVLVRPPYDSDRISVLRPDGSMAFDGFNRFACAPSLLIKSASMDAVLASGKFPSVVWQSSSASADCSVEVEVRKLALDCRVAGKREAMISVAISLIDRHRGVIGVASADASADANSGNYADAFSIAFSKAISAALRDL